MSTMRGLFFLRPGSLAWRDAPTPTLGGPGEALVRPLAVARCDLDAAILRGRAPFRGRALHWLRDALPHRLGRDGIFRRAPFAGPFAFGHECVAEVVAVGAEVTAARVGDRVVVPFQISCGVCDRCLRGLTAACTGVAFAATYGLGRGDWGGVLAELVRVPFADAMLVPAPDGVSAVDLASAGDNVADGLRTVASALAARPGASVLVAGGEAASVGLYAVACARALDAGEVVYVDGDRDRCDDAARLGAKVFDTWNDLRQRDFAITVDASADPAGLDAALRATEPGGTCTSVGVYFTPRTPVPLLPMFMRGITFHTGRVCSRAMLPQVLALIAGGRLRPSQVRTHVAPWAEAPRALHHAAPKVVITREG